MLNANTEQQDGKKIAIIYEKSILYDIPVRYDVVAISQTDHILTFKWIKNAFDYI